MDWYYRQHHRLNPSLFFPQKYDVLGKTVDKELLSKCNLHRNLILNYSRIHICSVKDILKDNVINFCFNSMLIYLLRKIWVSINQNVLKVKYFFHSYFLQISKQNTYSHVVVQRAINIYRWNNFYQSSCDIYVITTHCEDDIFF